MKLKNNLKDVNYRAKVVQLNRIENHPNADKLKVGVVDFQKIVIGLEAKAGDTYIFIPAEACINKDILSFNNQFSKSVGLNTNQRFLEVGGEQPLSVFLEKAGLTEEEFTSLNGSKPIIRDSINGDKVSIGKYTIGGTFGFFEKHGRVKALKIRGVVSEGFLMPIHYVNSWLESQGEKFRIGVEHVGVVFDSIGDQIFCKKFVNPSINHRKITVYSDLHDKPLSDLISRYEMTLEDFNSVNSLTLKLHDKLKKGDKFFVKKVSVKKGVKKAKRNSRLVENQFRLHSDTENLKRTIDRINAVDTITISEKLHGTSVVISRPLVKKKLGFFSKLLKNLGFEIIDTEHDLVYASRRVIKNEFTDQVSQNFYDSDVWGLHAKSISHKVEDGYTIYGEIVGNTETGSPIQGGYDYGCGSKESKLFVYRITYTTPQGRVIELTHPQVQRYCLDQGLEMPKTHFHGYARDYTKNTGTSEGLWRSRLLKKLQEDFNEMDCPDCVNKVPREGIILRKESDIFEAYKLKSNRFLERETKDIDAGVMNIEDQI